MPVKIALWDILELPHQTMIINVSNATRASTTTKMGKHLVLYARPVLTVKQASLHVKHAVLDNTRHRLPR